MQKVYTLIFFILLSCSLKGQFQGLENLDSKYGFNKFRLEEPFAKYSSTCNFLYNGLEKGVKTYEYTGPKIDGVFGYFSLKRVNLSFYNDKLSEIEIQFENISKPNEKIILTELMKLFESPQKVGNPDESTDFFYAWLSDKALLYYQKWKQRNGIPAIVTINVSSFKIIMEIQNNKF